MTIKIGISTNPKFAPNSSIRIAYALAQNFDNKNTDSAVEYFQEGIEYMTHGLENTNATFQEHESKIKELVNQYFERYDGLAIPGNALNINEKFYSGLSSDLQSINFNQPISSSVAESTRVQVDRRTILEIALVQGALERGIPVFGICGGNQVISIALGGKIKTVSDAPFSEQKKNVIYLKDTQLHGIVQLDRDTNDDLNNLIFPEISMHHQAIDPETLPYVLLKSAEDAEGVIKAVEMKGHHPWVVGVQFHPEYEFTSDKTGKIQNMALFKDFLDACRVVKEQKQLKAEMLKTIHPNMKLRDFKSENTSHFDSLVINFVANLEKMKFEDIDLIDIKAATTTIPALIHVFQGIEPNDRVKFAKVCEDLINRSDISQIMKLFEYIPAEERNQFFKEIILDEGVLVKSFNYLSDVNKFLLTDSLKDNLGIDFDKFIKLVTPANKSKKVNDCSRLCEIFKILPENICEEFIVSNKNKINDKITQFVEFHEMLESVPENIRLKFATIFQDKINDAGELADVVPTLKEADRVEFALRFEDKIIDGIGLSSVVDVLADQDKVEFAKKFEALINNEYELSLVLDALASNDRVKFAEDHIDKISDTVAMCGVLKVLLADDRVKFAEDHIDKVIDVKDLCLVLEVLSAGDRLKFVEDHKDKIQNINELTSVVKVLGREGLKLDSVINELITDGPQLILFLKSVQRGDGRFDYAIKFMGKISNETEFAQLLKLFLSKEHALLKEEFASNKQGMVSEFMHHAGHSPTLYAHEKVEKDKKELPSEQTPNVGEIKTKGSIM